MYRLSIRALPATETAAPVSGRTATLVFLVPIRTVMSASAVLELLTANAWRRVVLLRLAVMDMMVMAAAA